MSGLEIKDNIITIKLPEEKMVNFTHLAGNEFGYFIYGEYFEDVFKNIEDIKSKFLKIILPDHIIFVAPGFKSGFLEKLEDITDEHWIEDNVEFVFKNKF